MGLFDSFNPFTGFGLVDAAVEHVSAKDLQQREADIGREMFEKSSAHDIDMFNRESEFAKSQMADQFGYNRKLAADQYGYNMSSVYETPGRMVAGLKAAGLNPILAATGGFRSNAPSVGLPSSSAVGASAKSNSPSRGSGGQRANSNIALASKMGQLIESEVDLNTAKAEAERARAGITNTKDAMLQFAKQVLNTANEALKAIRESGFFGQTNENVDSILDNINMILNAPDGIEITEHTRKQLMKVKNQLKAYEGKTGGRNRRNKK